MYKLTNHNFTRLLPPCYHNMTTTGSHDHRTDTRSSDHHSVTIGGGSHGHSSPVTKSPDRHTAREVVIESEEEALSKLYKEDSIGDTVFSKAWALSILVNIVKAVSNEQDQTHPENSGDTNVNISHPNEDLSNKSDEGVTDSPIVDDRNGVDSVQSNVGNTHAESDVSLSLHNMSEDRSTQVCKDSSGEDSTLELDEQFEGQLCALWDASMNEDVAKYIHEQHGVELLLGAANRSIVPRLTEICLGILGNMLCIEEICVQGVGKAQIGNILQSIQSTDSGILCQAIRLIHACLSHENVHSLWLPEIQQCTAVKETLLFILQGSTNDELLACTSELLDLLLNTSESLLELWLDDHLVEAICEAAEQSRASNFHETCLLVSTLHTLTTIENGVACVVTCTELVSTLLCDFLLTLDHMEFHTCHVTALTAALSVLLTLIDSESHCDVQGAKVKLKDPVVLQALQNLRSQSNLFTAEHLSKLLGLISRILDSCSVQVKEY